MECLRENIRQSYDFFKIEEKKMIKDLQQTYDLKWRMPTNDRKRK